MRREDALLSACADDRRVVPCQISQPVAIQSGPLPRPCQLSSPVQAVVQLARRFLMLSRVRRCGTRMPISCCRASLAGKRSTSRLPSNLARPGQSWVVVRLIRRRTSQDRSPARRRDRHSAITFPLCCCCQGLRRVFLDAGGFGGMFRLAGVAVVGWGWAREWLVRRAGVRGVSRPRWSQSRSPVALPGP